MSGVSSGLHTKGGESAYAQYVRHLEKTSSAVQTAMTAGTVEHFAQGYQDYLQNPLQVCMFTSFPPTVILTFCVATHGQPPKHYVPNIRTGPCEISQL